MSMVDRIRRMRAIQNTFDLKSQKEIDIHKMQKFISQHFKDTSVFEENTLIDGCKQKLIVMKGKGDMKKIMAYPLQTFKQGQIIDCYNKKWLVTKIDQNQQIYTMGEMMYCPYFLDFQDSQGNIISLPYLIDGSGGSLDENKIVTTSNSSRKIKMQFNKYTQNFYIDKRFMGQIFNGIPQCWKVKELDAQTEENILIVSLEKDEFIESVDNTELGICNYLPPKNINPIINITCNGNLQVNAGGLPKTFTAQVNDEQGNIITSPTIVWEIGIPEGYEKYITSQTGRDTISISSIDTSFIIGKTFKLKATYESVSSEIDVKVVSLI